MAWDLADGVWLEVASPRNRAPSAHVVVHRRASGLRAVVRRGVPCTDPLRTVLDLAGTGDEALVVGALDRGIAAGLFTAAVVSAELERSAAVEVDGYGPHSSREAFQSDRARRNALVLAGWTVLRFTWADVRDRPAAVAAVLRRALAASRPA